MQQCEAQRNSLKWSVQAELGRLKLVTQMAACNIVQPDPHLELAETA